MAEFLKDTQLVAAIEEMIEKADEFLWLISPYIKLHDRVKTLLKKVTNYNQGISVVIIFGKNEEALHKSISKEDVSFLKELPNILIGYEKRLHAKYYASEDFSIITSMNLHQFSSNNNIEAGIKLKSNKWFGTNDDKVGKESFDYFLEVIEQSTVIYEKESIGKSTMFGLKQEYSHSEIKTDDTENFFKQPDYNPEQVYRKHVTTFTQTNLQNGFCIRTGKPIPFNIQRPMCKEAYDSWSKFKNPDYKEKYCHKTGKSSNGMTSMRNPIL